MAKVMDAASASMKAFGSKGPGKGCEMLVRPPPQVMSNHCVVKVSAVGLNPTDWKHVGRGMHYYTVTKATEAKPVILGNEGSGIVEAVAEGESGFQIGQRVWFMKIGSCAEHVQVKVKHMSPAPEQMSMEEAGSTPLALLTAYQSMRNAGYFKEGCGKGKRILVHAGAGGVGHFAVQLAKIYGFDEIITTCSRSNEDFVKELGATSIVDYKSEDFVQMYADSKFDIVVDPVGGEPVGCCCSANNKLARYTPRSRKVTKTSGVVVGIITGTTLEGPCGPLASICCSCLPAYCAYKCCGACGLAPKYSGPFFLEVDKAGEDLTKLSRWVKEGFLKTKIAKTFSFDETPDALTMLEDAGGHNVRKTRKEPLRGKIVIKVVGD